MRFLIILSVACLCGCNYGSRSKQKNAEREEKTSQPILDSFNKKEISIEPSLQNDIVIDTITLKRKQAKFSMVYPEISRKNYPEVYMIVDSFVKKQKKDFIGDDACVEVRPLSLYKTTKVISFSFEYSYITPGAMRHFYKYFTINYNLLNKRRIAFSDYFVLKNRADTAFFKKIIKGAIDWYNDSTSHYFDQAIPNTKFAFDKENLYFFFDMFETPFAPTGLTGSVSKRYIISHIAEAYQ